MRYVAPRWEMGEESLLIVDEDVKAVVGITKVATTMYMKTRSKDTSSPSKVTLNNPREHTFPRLGRYKWKKTLHHWS